MRVVVVGVGEFGSRHLQSLAALNRPVEIHAVEPSDASWDRAQTRLLGTNSESVIRHRTIESLVGSFDAAIVATCSDVRCDLARELIHRTTVGSLILDKVLSADVVSMSRLSASVRQKGVRAWVNCTMRESALYQNIREQIQNRSFRIEVVGSRFGLMTSAIHFADLLCWWQKSLRFDCLADGLERKAYSAKRERFLETDGSLVLHGNDNCSVRLTSFSEPDVPLQVKVHVADRQWTVFPHQDRVRITEAGMGGDGEEYPAHIPKQSELTAALVVRIVDERRCDLVLLDEAIEIHRRLYDPIVSHLKSSGISLPFEYPFT